MGSPYGSLIQVSEENLEQINSNKEEKEKEYNLLSEKTKYFDYWITAFGDSGIRKYVIDEIVPALNANIDYWMQFLIENKISLKFNNEFEETIEKFPTDNKVYNYETMSNGQRRRINLAVSQAFAHVMSLNSGKTPNVVFLDEVTSNVDSQGVSGIYNISWSWFNWLIEWLWHFGFGNGKRFYKNWKVNSIEWNYKPSYK